MYWRHQCAIGWFFWVLFLLQTSERFARVTTPGLYFKFSYTKMKESNVYPQDIPTIRC